jgi:hypothetical protein
MRNSCNCLKNESPAPSLHPRYPESRSNLSDFSPDFAKKYLLTTTSNFRSNTPVAAKKQFIRQEAGDLRKSLWMPKHISASSVSVDLRADFTAFKSALPRTPPLFAPSLREP